EDIKTRL
ncbi:unnamed protein product, partial [Allacma fusca]